jgi:NAD(P)-dependent dehydrogenase (short-subunit alcohol dehydrogenase family)
VTGRVEGKVAVVTGAASGIGAVTASRLAAEGGKVVVADIDAAGAEAHAQAINASGGEAIGVAADISDEDAVRAMVDAAAEAFGAIDILHANAAAVDLIPRDLSVLEADRELWDRTFAVNVTGTMLCARSVIPQMITRGGGSIVITSSVAGLAGEVVITAYSTSKWAVIQLMRSIASQHGRDGIRCNAVCPGLVFTERVLARFDGPDSSYMLKHTPLARAGTPEDIANAVLYLGSDEASYVTGQVLSIDGGMTMHQPTYADSHDFKWR